MNKLLIDDLDSNDYVYFIDYLKDTVKIDRLKYEAEGDAIKLLLKKGYIVISKDKKEELTKYLCDIGLLDLEYISEC